MKKLLAILSFTFLLSSCAGNDVVLPVVDPTSTVQAQAKNTDVEKNLFEKIEAYYAKPNRDSYSSGLDKTISQMLVKVKSLTGQQKYDNGKTSSKYYLYANDELLAHGSVRFGKDGKLYFEHWISSGEYDYCEIGTYTKAPSIKDGENVSIKLNNNFKMVFKGQGLNPMAHNKIYIKTNSDANIKTVKKAPEEFI